MTKKQLLLIWVAKFGFSTSIILQEVLAVENKRVRNLIYELSATHKKGIPTIPSLKRVEVNGLQGQTLYMLTEAGLAEATRSNAQDYRYSYKVSEMINFDLLLHSLGVQFICARLFVKSGEKDISGIIPERLISAESGEKRPDALIFRNGEQTAIEYERTEKSGDRLDRFFQEIEAKILQKKYPIFLIYTEIEGISQRYRNHLKSPFNRWKMGEKSRKWESISKKSIAEEAKGKILISTLVDIRRATHPISFGMAKKGEEK
jgi:hypothetical protein